MIAQILTPWTGTGTDDDDYRPLLADNYAIDQWRDVTGQDATGLVPAPNLYTVEVTAAESVIDDIDNDLDYFVLWAV